MSKFFKRVNMAKVLHCIFIKDFSLIVEGLNALKAPINTVTLECKRGKFKRIISNPPEQILTPQNGKIVFAETFMQISQFYIDQKKGSSQSKTFEIVIKGADSKGNNHNIGIAVFDLAPFVGRQDVPCNLNLTLIVLNLAWKK